MYRVIFVQESLVLLPVVQESCAQSRSWIDEGESASKSSPYILRMGSIQMVRVDLVLVVTVVSSQIGD